MSNVALFNPGNLPAFAKTRELSAMSRALAGGASGGKRISIKGGVFRLIDGGKELSTVEERYLDVVIVNAAPTVNRVWYAKKYDGDAVSAPDCWSADDKKPSPLSKDAQSASCATCPQNISGSGEGNSRACRFQQRLAVVLADDVTGAVMELTVPALSLFGKEVNGKLPLQAYAKWLSHNSVDIAMVVTRMSFDTSAESPKLFFKTMRWLTDDEYAQVVEQGKSAEAIDAVTVTFSASTKESAAVSAPAEFAGSRPKKAAPAPVAEEAAEEEAEAPAPVVKKTVAKTVPTAVAPKANLAATIAAWDDED